MLHARSWTVALRQARHASPPLRSTRPWRRQSATASRPLAGPRPARTLTNAPRDPSSCTADGPLIACRDRAPAAGTVAREPAAASSPPKGCAPTPRDQAAYARAARKTPGRNHSMRVTNWNCSRVQTWNAFWRDGPASRRPRYAAGVPPPG